MSRRISGWLELEHELIKISLLCMSAAVDLAMGGVLSDREAVLV